MNLPKFSICSSSFSHSKNSQKSKLSIANISCIYLEPEIDPKVTNKNKTHR